jgi:His-Xaa-Ser system protein HxsD
MLSSAISFMDEESMTIDVRFDETVFTVDAVKAACYRFLDKFSTSIEVREGAILCSIRFDPVLSQALMDAEIENLKKEVLDQELRQKLKVETEGIRNLILAHAFSKTGLIADE